MITKIFYLYGILSENASIYKTQTMKLRSYKLLFRLFSALSDKTNGAPLFVKYKLLLGTLILGVVSSSASKPAKEMTCYDVPEALSSQITCYKPAIQRNSDKGIPDTIEVIGKVTDNKGQPIYGVTVGVKNKTTAILTSEAGHFRLKTTLKDKLIFSFIGLKTREINAYEIMEDEPIVMEDDDVILCYDVIVVPVKNREITQISYNKIQTAPVSPVGNLEKFQKWLEANIKYNKQMQKEKLNGQLLLNFAIDKKGKITEAKILSSLSSDADAEALRVLSSCGKWEPGVHNGKTIKTMITIPVRFIAK